MVRFATGQQPLMVALDQSVLQRGQVGGKGASLSQLSVLGAPVPKACALTTAAYTTFASSLGLPTHMSDTNRLDLASVRAELLNAALPGSVADAIADAYRVLATHSGSEPALAVRSSATVEDSAELSFAGLHDTLLNVRSLPALEAAVRTCWASRWSERAVAYRHTSGLAGETAGIAVVVQQMIQSDVSFVVFTADPVSGNDEHVVISASWGLGEAVVSGMVTPDHIVVGPDGEVLQHTVGHKDVMVIPGSSPEESTRQVAVPRMLQTVPVMTNDVASDIASTARALATRLGYHADIEGGIAGGSIHLFQARPITTLRLQSHQANTARGAAASTTRTWDPSFVRSTT